MLKLSAIALLASSTSLMAQSKSFEGASIAAYASTVGATVDGSLTNSNNEVTTGTIGKNTPIAGLDLAFAFLIAAIRAFSAASEASTVGVGAL